MIYVQKAVKTFRRRLAFVLFGIFLAWPVVHIALVKQYNLSSWRFFGWGMYATPIPEAQTRLRVVIRDKNKSEVPDLRQWHISLTKLSREQEHESQCINLFQEEPQQGLRGLARTGLCRNKRFATDLDYFVHFGSVQHLHEFISEALSRAEQAGSETLVFLARQRFNIFQKDAFIESDIYKIIGDEVQYLGKVK